MSTDTETLKRPAPLHLNEDSLQQLQHLLPASALELVRVVGPAAALALVTTLPGVQVLVPREATASASAQRRWALLQDVVGSACMPALVAEYGGSVLEVPSCLAARQEQRNRWMRARFDALTGPLKRTKSAAVSELGIDLALAGWPMSYRQIETCLDMPDLTPQLHDQAADRRADADPTLPLFPVLGP